MDNGSNSQNNYNSYVPNTSSSPDATTLLYYNTVLLAINLFLVIYISYKVTNPGQRKVVTFESLPTDEL